MSRATGSGEVRLCLDEEGILEELIAINCGWSEKMEMKFEYNG